MRPSRITTPPAARISSGTERQLTGALTEAELDEQRLPGRADDGLPVDALEAELAASIGGDELRERLEARVDARVVGVGEDEDAASAALDVQHRLAARDDDLGAGRALRALALALALGPWQRGAVGLRRVGGCEHDRRRLVLGLLRAQPLDRAGQRELRPAEPFDEVAAPADAERLERAERVVEEAEPAGRAFGEHVLAGDDPVALQQQLGARAAAQGGWGSYLLCAEDGARQRPAALDRRAGAAAA